VQEGQMQIYRPDGRRFLSSVELDQRAEQEAQRADAAVQALYTAAERLLSMGLSLEQVAQTLDLPMDRLKTLN
jgi:hypothetical protein